MISRSCSEQFTSRSYCMRTKMHRCDLSVCLSVLLREANANTGHFSSNLGLYRDKKATLPNLLRFAKSHEITQNKLINFFHFICTVVHFVLKMFVLKLQCHRETIPYFWASYFRRKEPPNLVDHFYRVTACLHHRTILPRPFCPSLCLSNAQKTFH